MRGAPALGLALVLCGCGGTVAPSGGGGPGASLVPDPGGPVPAGPDLLLVVLGDVRADGVGPLTMPRLSAWLGRGRAHTDALAAGTSTWTTVTSLFTGRPPQANGAIGPGFPPSPGVPVLAGLLAEAGWATALVTADHAAEVPGLGFHAVLVRPHGTLTTCCSDDEALRTYSEVVAALLARERPAFVALVLAEARAPYLAIEGCSLPEPLGRWFADPTAALPAWARGTVLAAPDRVTPAMLARLGEPSRIEAALLREGLVDRGGRVVDHAVASVRGLRDLDGRDLGGGSPASDAAIWNTLRSLADREAGFYPRGWPPMPHDPRALGAEPEANSLARTLYDCSLGTLDAEVDGVLSSWFGAAHPHGHRVVVVGDRGVAFGEHGGLGAGGRPWPEVTRVPLWVGGDGVSAEVVHRPVAAHDAFSTLAEAAGLAVAGASPSLLGELPSRRARGAASWALDGSGDDPVQAFVDELALLRDARTGAVLGVYDPAADPWWLSPLPASEAQVQALGAAADAWFRPTVTPVSGALDEHTRDRLEDLGYLDALDR